MSTKIIKCWSQMKTEKSQPSDQWTMLEIGKPRFRYYLFTLGLGFLCLHQCLMIDSIYPLIKALSMQRTPHTTADKMGCQG